MPLSSTFAEVVERVVHARRSVRHFSGELIKQGDLDRIVGAGIAAPNDCEIAGHHLCCDAHQLIGCDSRV